MQDDSPKALPPSANAASGVEVGSPKIASLDTRNYLFVPSVGLGRRRAWIDDTALEHL
jgi:hypothetical protein